MPEPLTAPGLSGLRVFISYPRGGRTHSLAEETQQYLRARGAYVFRDETGVREGDTDAIAAIERELLATHVVAYLLGEDTPDSTWQKREALFADRERIALVVAQTASIGLPLEVSEKQPVDATQAPALWLPKLAAALQRETQSRERARAWAALPAARQAERAYLLHWLSGDFSDRAARYTAVAGVQQRSMAPQARRKSLYHDANLWLALAGPAGAMPAEEDSKPCTDVLHAYQEMLARRGASPARLAVLGEPGAGKSFSLQRLFCELADRALQDADASVPLMLALGDWTRASDSFEDFLDKKLRPHGLDTQWRALRDAGRAVLLLDGLNEIPVSQRAMKSDAVFRHMQDTRWRGALISCRARDFQQRELQLPLDRLTLQPLSELQILEFLRRWELTEHAPELAEPRAQTRFWSLAAGPALAAEAAGVLATWQQAGADWELFWHADDIPRENPKVYAATSGNQDTLWRVMRRDERSLLRMAASPFWLELLAGLPAVPLSKARLFAAFLQMAYAHGEDRCRKRHALDEVPTPQEWDAGLSALALALQGEGGVQAAGSDDSSVQTRLPRADCPAALTDTLLEFGIAVQVLKESDGQIHFAHQLLQEALAARALTQLALDGRGLASSYWPPDAWWQRNGWEVVAELAAESLAHEPEAASRLVAWLAEAQPEVASRAWVAAGRPPLLAMQRQRIVGLWAAGLTDLARWPKAAARAAIGRAVGSFDLDERPGIGLRPDGVPDIEWVPIADAQPFVYQGAPHAALAPYDLARYPVTHRQYQAFIDAGGYQNERWWRGLAKKFEAPADAGWTEPNGPRERVSWFEAVAFCRWMSQALGAPGSIRLPTEQEWERAAAGLEGWEYPFSASGYKVGHANVYESGDGDGHSLQRTSAVGLFPNGVGFTKGLHDLAGNVWEWCLNEHKKPSNTATTGDVPRVLRGGSWGNNPSNARASFRFRDVPDFRVSYIGFRVCRASPIETLVPGAAGR